VLKQNYRSLYDPKRKLKAQKTVFGIGKISTNPLALRRRSSVLFENDSDEDSADTGEGMHAILNARSLSVTGIREKDGKRIHAEEETLAKIIFRYMRLLSLALSVSLGNTCPSSCLKSFSRS
jgi:hypothetical protein